jgi:hypothetical protein
MQLLRNCNDNLNQTIEYEKTVFLVLFLHGISLFAQVSEEQTIKGIYKSALNANVTVGLTIYPIKLVYLDQLMLIKQQYLH